MFFSKVRSSSRAFIFHIFSTIFFLAGTAAAAPLAPAPRTLTTTPTTTTTTPGTTTPQPSVKPAENVLQMQPMTITATRERAVTTEGPAQVQTYDSAQINDEGSFSVEEFLENLPPGDDGDEDVVLIDGQPAYIDPETIPLNMIERIQVSLGGIMPEFGIFTQGKVINIILKKTYSGGEMGGRLRGSFDGGGFYKMARASYSVTRGKWHTFISANYAQTNQLLSSDRDYSRNQDHTELGGRDLRVAWGSVAAVQAVSGNLNGILDANGLPVSAALVPEGQDGSGITLADFIAGGDTAYGLRRYNTSEYRLLIAPSKRYNGSFGVNYKFNDKYRIALRASYLKTTSDRIGAPPTTAVSSQTVVPAAYNPFGQDIQIGMVHDEFGPTHQSIRSDRTQFGATFHANPSTKWRWRIGGSYLRATSHTEATDLDKEAFAESLANPDPALRFNPFGDSSAGPVNAHLYPDLTIHRTREDITETSRIDGWTNIQVVEMPAGPLRVVSAFNALHTERDRSDTHPTADTPPSSHQKIDRFAASVWTNIPLFGRNNTRPLLRRLEVQGSAYQALQSDDHEQRNLSTGLVWSPARPLLLRARYSDYKSTPASTVIAGSESLVGQTFVDPARDDEAATDVDVFSRDTVSAVPAKTTVQTLGFTFEPTFVKGLRFTASHNVRKRHNIYQSRFNSQEIINNEASFPGRVIRADPTPEDVAAGLPGRITGVDTTPGNTGEAESTDLKFSLEYRLPTQRYGRFQLRAYATHMLDAKYYAYPGIEYVSRSGGGASNPHEWTMQGHASWNHKGWNTVVRVNYAGTFMTEPPDGSENASVTVVNFDISYRFNKALWGKFGKGLRVGVGVANCFDREPLYADTIVGYRGVSPLGRMYTCAVTMPL